MFASILVTAVAVSEKDEPDPPSTLVTFTNGSLRRVQRHGVIHT